MWELLWPTICAGCEVLGRGVLCPACLPVAVCALPPPECVTAAWVLGRYDEPIGAAVRRAKFRPDRHVAVALGRLLADACTSLPPFDGVVPAPSTLSSRLHRGFATAAVLAGPVAARSRTRPDHALHLAPGLRQSASTGPARRGNLAGRLRSTRAVRGTVLLVDDVFTTGATASACARELLGAGATQVLYLGVCQTPVQIL